MSNKIKEFRENLKLVFDDDLRTKSPEWKNTIDYLIIGLIIVSTLGVFLSTFSSLKQYTFVLNIIEVVTVVCFTIEIALRIWTVDLLDNRYKGFRGRILYCCSFYGLTDLIAIVPFYINLFLPTPLSAFRIMRVFRFMRLFNYMKSSRLLLNAITSKKNELTISLSFLTLLTVVLSVLLYFVEHEAQPDQCENGWQTFVWAFAKYLSDPGKIADFTLQTPAANFIAFIVGLLGIAIFAVPTGIISSGITEALADDKREKELKEYGSRIRKSFRRELNKKTGYRVAPRRVPVISLQAKKGMSEKDIIDTVSKFKEFRLRNLATSQVASEHPQDRLVIEMLPLDEQTVDGYTIERSDYGIKIDRDSNVTIITPSAASENSIGHVGYYLAQFGGFNYISREFVTDVDEPVSYYKIEGEREEWEKPLQKFVDDITDSSKDSQHWNIILVSSDNVYDTQFHFVHRAKEKTGLQHTTLDEDRFQEFYAAFSEKMKAEYEYLSDMDEAYKPVGNKNIGLITGGGTKNNAFTLRISYSVTTWSSSSAPIIVDMVKVIKQHLEKPDRRTFKDDPSWKDVGCGYGINNNQ